MSVARCVLRVYVLMRKLIQGLKGVRLVGRPEDRGGDRRGCCIHVAVTVQAVPINNMPLNIFELF